MQSFVGCNITHATPRDASVGSRDIRDSSFKFEHAAVIKLLIMWLPVKLSHFPFTHSLLIFLGNYVPKNNYENRQTRWVRILQKCHCLSVTDCLTASVTHWLTVWLAVTVTVTVSVCDTDCHWQWYWRHYTVTAASLLSSFIGFNLYLTSLSENI